MGQAFHSGECYCAARGRAGRVEFAILNPTKERNPLVGVVVVREELAVIARSLGRRIAIWFGCSDHRDFASRNDYIDAHTSQFSAALLLVVASSAR